MGNSGSGQARVGVAWAANRSVGQQGGGQHCCDQHGTDPQARKVSDIYVHVCKEIAPTEREKVSVDGCTDRASLTTPDPS
jgi:hypothetical protein